MSRTAERPREPGENPTGLLETVRVIEVSLLAPSALGGHLAELGAEVIKVESGTGDYVRSIGRRRNQRSSDMHQLWNRGKRSVAIDLDEHSGRETFRRLVGDADVVIEGRRPGYLSRLGLGYDELLTLNPALVFTSMSGFGDTGPYRDIPTHGPAFDAYAGVAPPDFDDCGRPRIPRPGHMLLGVLTAPVYAAFATVAAVLNARMTGQPAYIDACQADAAVYAQALDLARWRADHADQETSPQSSEDDHDDLFSESVLVQYYQTSDGRFVLLQALERKFFQRFASLVGRPEWIEHFPSDKETDWLYGRRDIRAQIADIFATNTSAYWVDICQRNNIALTPVHTGPDLMSNPQFLQRARWLPNEDGLHTIPGLPIQVQPPQLPCRRAPQLGEHSAEILSGMTVESAGEAQPR